MEVPDIRNVALLDPPVFDAFALLLRALVEQLPTMKSGVMIMGAEPIDLEEDKSRLRVGLAARSRDARERVHGVQLALVHENIVDDSPIATAVSMVTQDVNVDDSTYLER